MNIRTKSFAVSAKESVFYFVFFCVVLSSKRSSKVKWRRKTDGVETGLRRIMKICRYYCCCCAVRTSTEPEDSKERVTINSALQKRGEKKKRFLVVVAKGDKDDTRRAEKRKGYIRRIGQIGVRNRC